MKSSAYESQLPGIIVWVKLYADPGRIVIIARKKISVEMIRHVGDERLMIFWHAELVGWIICWEHGVEKTMESATASETDIANSHGQIRVPWTWHPQGMSVRRILDCKLFAEDVVVVHREKGLLLLQLKGPVGE
jgi:hypothetical protein